MVTQSNGWLPTKTAHRSELSLSIAFIRLANELTYILMKVFTYNDL